MLKAGPQNFPTDVIAPFSTVLEVVVIYTFAIKTGEKRLITQSSYFAKSVEKVHNLWTSDPLCSNLIG